MANGRKTGGRKKGTPNRATRQVKEAIEMVAENLGGVDRMTAWAKEDTQNERLFWTSVYPKILPLQVDHGVQEDNPLKAMLEQIAANGKRVGS